jgi:phospholipid transport system substrate-binding protein
LRLAVAAGVVVLVGGHLGAETLGPLARTRQVLEKSHDIVVGPGEHRDKVTALNTLLGGFLDTDAMGRKAMGRHLDGRSPEQVRAFLDVFRQLFVRTYVQRLLLFDVPEFGYRGETVKGDEATVGTEIITPKDRFGVDYRMRRAADGWRATDILVEEASLGDNFRAQFDAALAKESFDSLMERLRKKVTGPEKAGL